MLTDERRAVILDRLRSQGRVLATDLGVVYILTGGGPANTTHVLTTLAFQRGVLGADLGQGAAIAVFLLPFLIVVAVLMLRLAHRTEVGARPR